MNTITVNVTKDDIMTGLSCAPCHCPVALAMDRAGYLKPTVQLRTATFLVKVQQQQKRVSVELTPEVINFINSFDLKGRHAVNPFSFELPSPRQPTERDG